MKSNAPAPHPPKARQLLTGIALLLVLWTLILPTVAQVPALREFADFLESRGVDPNAKFFSDQRAGFIGSRKVMQRVQSHPTAFWGRLANDQRPE